MTLMSILQGFWFSKYYSRRPKLCHCIMEMSPILEGIRILFSLLVNWPLSLLLSLISIDGYKTNSQKAQNRSSLLSCSSDSLSLHCIAISKEQGNYEALFHNFNHLWNILYKRFSFGFHCTNKCYKFEQKHTLII